MAFKSYVFRVYKVWGEATFVISVQEPVQLPLGIFERGTDLPKEIRLLCEELNIDPELEYTEYLEVLIPQSYKILAKSLTTP
jgi:hypothetical protein